MNSEERDRLVYCDDAYYFKMLLFKIPQLSCVSVLWGWEGGQGSAGNSLLGGDINFMVFPESRLLKHEGPSQRWDLTALHSCLSLLFTTIEKVKTEANTHHSILST